MTNKQKQAHTESLQALQGSLEKAWTAFCLSTFSTKSENIIATCQVTAFKNRFESNAILENIHSELVKQGALAPSVFSSLTHTQGVALALGLGCQSPSAPNPVAGIGVDLEWSQRKVHDAVIQRVVHPAERAIKLAFLDHWVIKEACFKANPKSDGTVITQYRLRRFSLLSDGGEGEAGFFDSEALQGIFPFRLLHTADWTVALACSLRRASSDILI